MVAVDDEDATNRVLLARICFGGPATRAASSAVESINSGRALGSPGCRLRLWGLAGGGAKAMVGCPVLPYPSVIRWW